MKKELLLSICIPTFNRSPLIKALLFQLNEEFDFSFEVIVVNDGSSDNTKECLESINIELKFPLRVFHQENKGRASALKKAILEANGEFVMIMDDDDRFIISSLKKVGSNLKDDLINIKSERKIAGLVYLANNILDDKLVGTKFPQNNFVSNLITIRSDHSVKGDKKEIIKRSIVQKIMYNVPVGESRMPTSVLWARIAKEYDIICKNIALIQKQYLSDGLTKNLLKKRVENPVSSMMGYFEIITMPKALLHSKLYMMRNSINYFRFYFHIKNRFSIFYFLFAGIMGFMASIYDKITGLIKK